MSYDDTRNDVKVLVEKIETLATQVKDKLDNGGDYLTLANELVRIVARLYSLLVRCAP